MYCEGYECGVAMYFLATSLHAISLGWLNFLNKSICCSIMTNEHGYLFGCDFNWIQIVFITDNGYVSGLINVLLYLQWLEVVYCCMSKIIVYPEQSTHIGSVTGWEILMDSERFKVLIQYGYQYDE